MTVNYNMVWAEDNQDFVDNHRDEFETYLESKGFQPKIFVEKNYEDFVSLSRTVSLHEIDLFLIDLRRW